MKEKLNDTAAVVRVCRNRRFSMKRKLSFLFGLLIAASLVTEGFLAVGTARKAVIEKIEIHLTDKASDVADILDGRMSIFFQFAQRLARIQDIYSDEIPYSEKLKLLQMEASFNKNIVEINISDTSGKCFFEGGYVTVNDRQWFQNALKGENFAGEPVLSKTTGKLITTFAVPIYGENKNIVGVLSMDIDGLEISKQISDIVVGKTGYCYIAGLTGSMIAHKDETLVKNLYNPIEEAKKNPDLLTLAAFTESVIGTSKSTVGYYTFNGISNIASFETMQTTGWKVVIKAPVKEFMHTVIELRRKMAIFGICILAACIMIIYIVSARIVYPIITAVNALHNIAQGEGDLTVRLPLIGNDEITDLSLYFNRTIEKIGSSIKIVGTNSFNMKEVANKLTNSMTETSDAVYGISSHIETVKQQALAQAGSVTKTAAAIEEIIGNIKQLNNSIESQAAGVSHSSAAIEQMVANIDSVTKTLYTADETIKILASATDEGKETVAASSMITQNIAEESGSLLEASNVIQHIASQTNLLAMNAAIEAAHAGEAGQGFAVVADEIRKLAEESSMQGQSITATLKILSGEIETLSAAAKTAEEKFSVIFNLSCQVKNMSERLMEAMNEQRNGSHEVLIAIRDINSITNQVNKGSAEMLCGGKSAAEEMRKLDELSQVIAGSMDKMSSGAGQISNAVQNVNEMTHKNKKIIDNLSNEVSKFKV